MKELWTCPVCGEQNKDQIECKRCGFDVYRSFSVIPSVERLNREEEQIVQSYYAEAKYRMGEYFYNGEGVKRNYEEAVKWYQKAANQGNADAQNRLGDCYYYGRGVKKSYGKAVRCYWKALKQGKNPPSSALGTCSAVLLRMMIRWYHEATEQGNADAQYNLGVCYYNGEGVERDYEEAVKWYRKAAEQGHADAQYNLGNCYYNGEGVERDYEEAVKWYRKAAEQGHVSAQKCLKTLNVS